MLEMKKDNGGRPFEKLSPIERYKEFNLPPDYFIDQFYLTTTAFTAKEINFAGNNISVMNAFLPGNVEQHALYYHTDSDFRCTQTLTQVLVNPKTFLVLPSMVYEMQYNRLYRTITSADNPMVKITNNNFTFSHSLRNSTPILVMLSRDIRPFVSESFKPDSFKQDFTSVIPTTGGGGNELKVVHGWNDLVKVGVNIFNAANAITVVIQQRNRMGSFFTEFTVSPGAFPFSDVFVLPEKVSDEVKITVTGGGAGEVAANEIDIDVMLSSRG